MYGGGAFCLFHHIRDQWLYFGNRLVGVPDGN